MVTRLREAGAILLGKTNLPELAMHPFESDNLVYGRTNNPYDLSHGPGGSSGGEAAIIAASGSAFGIGNDVAGSLRLPAHFCGIAALKPTSGRVPRTGMFPSTAGIANPLWQQGPMARSVADLGLILPIIAGEDGYDAGIIPMPLQSPQTVKLKNLRVAHYTDNGIVSSTPETRQTVHKTAQTLAEAGLIVEEKRPPHIEHSFALLRRLGGVKS